MNALSDYPERIAAADRAVLEQSQRVRSAAALKEARRAQFGAMVAEAYPPKQGNDGQRKTMLAELELTDPDFLNLHEALQDAQDRLAELRIEAELQRNLFRVELLMLEDAIAAKRQAISFEAKFEN